MDESKIIEAFDKEKDEVWTDDDQFTMGYNNGLEMGKNIALELLKEQEAVQPETKPSQRGIYAYVCGRCGWNLYEIRDTVHFEGRKLIHFCPYCGTPVEWD